MANGISGTSKSASSSKNLFRKGEQEDVDMTPTCSLKKVLIEMARKGTETSNWSKKTKGYNHNLLYISVPERKPVLKLWLGFNIMEQLAIDSNIKEDGSHNLKQKK
jgi:hypothetical protein